MDRYSSPNLYLHRVIILYGSTTKHSHPMTNPVLNSFFVGRALAQSLNEKLGETLTYTLSEIGKVNAEQGEKLRQFTALPEKLATQVGTLQLMQRDNRSISKKLSTNFELKLPGSELKSKGIGNSNRTWRIDRDYRIPIHNS
jgi:hypothetical protein